MSDGSCPDGNETSEKEGKLQDQEESDEINACSIVVPVEVDGKTEEWLVNFKNETHNHPTEIEPFGGAATCLGGAIRDPLSGRTYVYQAMRVTGAADPTVPVSETISGKLPQKKLVREAAHGYSSYGNQIGLATGYVKEVYHPNYVAKRMEIGAVMGAAPRRAVQRLTSDPGDIIIYLEEEPDVTVSVVPQVLQKRTTQSPQQSAVPRYRKVTRRQNARSSACSAVRKLPISSKNATISVRAVCL